MGGGMLHCFVHQSRRGGIMSQPIPPCKGCTRRTVDCHDAKTCPEWGRFRADLEAWRASYRAAVDEEYAMIQYSKRRWAAVRARANERGK